MTYSDGFIGRLYHELLMNFRNIYIYIYIYIYMVMPVKDKGLKMYIFLTFEFTLLYKFYLLTTGVNAKYYL